MCKSELFKKQNLYELIKDKIIDDCNLAKIIKVKGEHIWLGLTKLVESQRSYYKLKQIWKMVSRTAYEQLNYSIPPSHNLNSWNDSYIFITIY